MSKRSGYHENGGLSNKYFENFEFRKKCSQKWDENFEKLILCKFFVTNYTFYLECFQLSFDMHIVHVGQKCVFSKIVVPKVSKFVWSK